MKLKILKIREDKIKGFRKPTDIEEKKYGKYIRRYLDNRSLAEAVKLIAYVIIMIAIIIVDGLFAIVAVKFQDVAIVLAMIIGAMLVLIINQSFLVRKLNKAKDELMTDSFEMTDCLGRVTISGNKIELRNLDDTKCNTILLINKDSKYFETDDDNIPIVVFAIKKSDFYIIIDRDSIKR